MKKMSMKLCTTILAITMAVSLSACGKPKESTATAEGDKTAETVNYKIGVLQLVEHEALDSTREGFIAALSEAGYKDGENITIDIQNAQNDPSNLKTMSQKFVNDASDLILAIATSAAQSIATETTDIPILGTAITDYVGAGLIESNEKPNTNVSGTSDKTPVKEQFDLMMKILPETKTVGIMYNSSEINSEIQAKMAEEAAAALGLTSQFVTITNANDITQAVQSISGKVDVLYIPTDNTLASAMSTVTSITTEAKLPVIVGENGMVKAGGLATVGIDYFKLGHQTGQMAVRALEGEDISKMPIEFTENADICINLDTANALGILVPEEVIDSAAVVINYSKIIESTSTPAE